MFYRKQVRAPGLSCFIKLFKYLNANAKNVTTCPANAGNLLILLTVLGKVNYLVLSFLLTDLKNEKFLKDSPDITFMVLNIENMQFTKNTIISGIG
jgi:hypothetical protein